MRKRGIAASGLLAAGLLLATGSAHAREPEPASCGPGVEVRLSSVAPRQGSLVLVEVRSEAALEELKGAWAGQALQFWPSDDNPETQRALVGVDLDQPAARLPLTLSARRATGGRLAPPRAGLACSVLVKVEDGGFAVERLRVARRFVEVNPKDAERARREAARLREIFGEVTPERFWTGGFRAPLDGVEGSGNFGKRRILNGEPRSPHSGEDFSAPADTPVRAPQRGRVALADELFFSGKTVVLDHGLGLYTFYAHLSALAVKEGEVVEAGAVLGRVGATGRVTGAHLHWAARVNRQRVNPLELLAVLSE